MKRYFSLVVLVLIMLSISGCSSEPNVELVSYSVSIVNDKSITGSMVVTEGEKKGKELVPTALVYEFAIKNNGNKKIDLKKDKKTKENPDLYMQGNKIKIEPNEKLKNASQEIIGINIFEPSSYKNSGLGYKEASLILKSGEEKTFVLYYELGVNEESPYTLFITPPEDKLTELESNALDACLVLIVDDAEIARFDLNKQ